METIFSIILGISVLFFLLLGIKEFLGNNLKKKFCVVCVSVVLTWIFLLILLWLNIFQNKVILALLIGESTLGVFYLWEKNVAERFKLFRLPLLLTLILLAYTLIEGFIYSFPVVLFLAILWVFFFTIFAYRGQGKIGKLIKKIVECCKNW